MDTLPEEVLGAIFSRLSVPDLLYGVRPVCHTFHQIVADYCSERFLYNISEPYRPSQNSTSSIESLLQSNCTYKHFRITLDFTELVNKPLADRVIKAISEAKSIFFEANNSLFFSWRERISGKFLLRLLEATAENLESLKLRSCDEAFGEPNFRRFSCDDKPLMLPKLKEFGAEKLQRISDAFLARVLIAAPNLLSLSLAGCKIVTVKVAGTVKDSHVCEEVLSMPRAIEIIKDFAPGLTSLNVSNTKVASVFVNALCNTGNPPLNLQELSVEFCTELRTEDVVKIAIAFPDMKVFKARGLNVKWDSPLSAVTSESLVDLRIGHGNGPRAVVIQNALRRNPLLEVLSLTIQYQPNLFDGIQLAQLTTLELTTVLMLPAEWQAMVTTLKSNCSLLRTLNVFNSRLTNKDVQVVLASLPKLTKLRFWRCRGFTDAGLIGTDITGKETSEELERKLADSHSSSLKNLKDLLVLDLASSEISGISDVMLKYALGHPSLQYLDLSRSHVTNEGLKLVALNARNLQELRVERCKRITHSGVVEYMKTARRLRRITFCGDVPCTCKLCS